MKPKLTALFLVLTMAQPILASDLAEDGPLVAVASSLRLTWPALMDGFSTVSNGTPSPRVTFGSSGNLARQIVQGAPFELLLSADEGFTDWLIEKDATDHTPAVYALGRLAWVAKKDSALAEWASSAYVEHTLPRAPLPPELSRLSIANPAFAPYGRAAKQVLNVHELPSSVQLSLGENAMQAFQFALSGASDGGIVPLALVGSMDKKLFANMRAIPIPEIFHEPITHTMVLIGTAQEDSKSLFNYLRSDPAQRILKQHGFKAIH